MKKILYLLIVLFVPVFLSSCYDFPMNRLGFHSAFDNDSNGVTIARVDRFTDYIYLEGTVKIEQGEVEIELVDPAGEIVYRNCLNSTGKTHIYQMFHASRGFWKLKYKSKNGTGIIDLHVRF